MTANQKIQLVEMEGRVEEVFSGEVKLKTRLQEAKMVIKVKDERIQQLEVEVSSLEELMKPFREQLEAFDRDNKSLESKSASAQVEVKKLASQCRTTMGHQNHNLKIQ